MESETWGSRPSHFMIIPNTKRLLNNTKTNQLPNFEVNTGLPRPYLHSTHKRASTSSDRCVGLRIQPRCANAIAAPHRSQTTASCRSTRARTYGTRRATHPAPVVATYHGRVHTAAAFAVGLDALLKQASREAPRHVSSRPD